MANEETPGRAPQFSLPRAEKRRFTLAQRLMLAVVPRLVWALLWIVGRTWRFEVISEEGVTPVLFGQKSPPEIYCFWHRCILPADVYYRYSRSVIIISQSYDGELIARVARCFGYDAVRGSSSRGAREALLELKRVIESGRTAVFTADGPRGPIYQTKIGPIKLAQMTGAPINALYMEPEYAWVIRSWDKLLVPKPFSRIVVSWVRPTLVPADLAAEDFEPKRAELNTALERARLRAQDYFKKAQR
jgi:lysophospholipid acyltransferase (LPLAT)-like uncharacterized protein